MKKIILSLLILLSTFAYSQNKETEKILNKKVLTEDLIIEASEHAYHEVTPISDIRASEDYRREMIKVLLKHSLNEWL